MEYLKDSFDTGQIEDGFSGSKSIKGYRNSYSLPDPEQHQSSYNQLTQWNPGKKLLQPPIFRKESTSELTAKTKGSDKIFTIKFSLSQSLMVQVGTHNPNVTFKGYPKKFKGLFGQKVTEFRQPLQVQCLGTTDQLLPALPSPTPPSPKDTICNPIIESGKQLPLNTSHSIGKMAKATLLTSSANIGSLQLCGPCSGLSCSGGARLPPS